MVEGPVDEKFWADFIPDKFCKLQRVVGKPDVLRLLKANLLRGLPGIAGLVDADYALITESVELEAENLLYDDCCPDAELMSLCSPALAAVLIKASENSEQGYNAKQIWYFASRLKREALRLAMEFGYFRLLNDCNCYCIGFRDFWDSNRYDFTEFVDTDDTDSIQIRQEWFAIRLAEFHNEKRNTDFGSRVEHSELIDGVAELKKNDRYKTPNIQLCQGHETVALIAYLLPIMFQAAFGYELPTSMKHLVERRVLERMLRKEYREEYLVRTKLHDCIRNWESANKPYRILKPDI